MTSLYENIEQNLKTNNEVYLDTLEKMWAQTIELFETRQDKFSKVYGKSSGAVKTSSKGEIQAIVIGDDFFPIDNASAGTFEEGWLYTSSSLVKVGDLVDLHRVDDRKRRYKVDSTMHIGTTTSVFKKYRISAIGD